MVEFMLLAAPRSGTAWAANWLTTDRTLCLHEPLYEHTLAELDVRDGSRTLGMACTVSALLGVNRHPARKVVLHREPKEIRESMVALGIEGDYDFTALGNVEGQHHHWLDLFNNPKPIYEYLLQQSFDEVRHEQLRRFNIQNMFLISALQTGGHCAPANG